MSNSFSKFRIKNIEINNRIAMAPMCMYSADNEGKLNDWHFVHYVTRAVGKVGLIIQEATAVESRGRISHRDLGIWSDSHIRNLKRTVDECKKYGAIMGIQLAHAGRKCDVQSENIIAPSAIAFSEKYKTPSEMTKEDIRQVIQAFKEGAVRAEKAGYDIIELHAAHGYLINEFLSPLTNKREDEYGGSIENRCRFLKNVIKEVRTVWSNEKPLMIRVSAEEYMEEGNHPKDICEIINLVKEEGVDIINVSSGGVVSTGINTYPGYQIRYAEEIKKQTKLPVIAGGLITSPEMVEEIIQNNRADLVYLGRELLRNPYWCLEAENKLGGEIQWPSQYERAKK